MKKKEIVRLLILLLLLITMGIGEIQATVGIKSLGYKTDFASTSEPFNKGDIVTSNANIGSVLRVFNTTSRAYFNDAHTLRTNETVTVSFTAYHGYLGSTNKTSSVSVLNSDGVVLVGYTYNHTSGRITDVKIGGSTVWGFEEFDAISHYNSDQNANGIDGNGKPYRNGSGTYNPKITMQISENGTIMFNIYLSNKAIDKTIWGNVGSAAKNLSCIEINSNCDNSDRTICIDDLEISSNHYSQNYESGIVDWTTANSDRFTPVIIEDNGNHYLAGDPMKTDQNGSLLTGPNLNISSGTQYELSFDLKIAKANTDSPEFYYNDITGNKFFSIVQDGSSEIGWTINNSISVNLPSSNYVSLSNTINDRPWYHFKITWINNTCKITITNQWGTDTYLQETTITPLSAMDGIGRMMFGTGRYYGKFAIDNVELITFPTWSASSATVDITDVGATDPNVVAVFLPYLKEHRYEISNYSSSNTDVASFWPGTQLHIKGIGTTTITATDTQGNSASYNLTVTGTTVTPVINGNVLTFTDPGIIMNNTENTAKSHTLPKGLTVSYGYSNGNIGETAIVVSSESGSVLKLIDNNGYSRSNIGGNGVPYEGIYGGTFVKLEATANGYMVLTGNVSASRSRLYKNDGSIVDTEIDESEHTLAASLTSGSTYYLYNLRLLDDATDGVIVPLVNSISYVDACFVRGYDVIPIPNDANHSTPIQEVKGQINPTYTIECIGDVGHPTVSGTTITGIEGGGAIKVTATDGSSSASYFITVAYEATAYPGHLWDFYTEEKGLTTSDGMKNVPNPADASTKTQTGYFGDTWNAEWKNVNTNERPEWYRYNPINGDNAFVVPETAGLIFVNGYRNFFLRNDVDTYSHIGIRGNGGGTSFTIPLLKKDDIVEILWRHESAGSGSLFEATNLIDLRGKTVNEEFEITESAYRRIRSYVGPYSFAVAADGDVTFHLKDNGNNDIQSIRIYSGGYQPTMRRITLDGNATAPSTLLLDNSEDGYTYNYCNQLYSTATGPAMYVLKGYKSGRDDVKCVQGSNAADQFNYRIFTDENAYPVSREESDRLYEMRKNLVEFKMYNTQWLRGSNYPTYNFGHIDATSGWGKVTIRMNNYTADMKYLIGYTPDFTLTIGSAPHQTYPYTWDFTHISAQNVTGAATNVYNSIVQNGGSDEYYDEYNTNWEELTSAKYALKTDNSGPLSSQYVPGAVLVTTNRALSKFKGASSSVYALDEFDGLGFEGQIAFGSDNTINTTTRSISSSRSGGVVSLLSMQVDNYIDKTTDEDGIVIGGIFNHSSGEELSAGNGKVVFGTADKFELSPVASCGFGFKSDGDASSSKYVLLKPSRPFQAGDVISIKAYATSNPSGSDYGLALYQLPSSGHVTSLYLGAKQKNVEVTLSYTVTVGDNLEGRNGVYVFRATGKSTYITEAEIVGEPLTLNASQVSTWLYSAEDVTITIPELNADSKQDWIYISSSAAPAAVTNATLVTSGTDGPDANQSPENEDSNARVYKYKVDATGNAYVTFEAGTKIYKIGVTHILKEIHPVGGVGWATEIRKHSIDHELTGYFTKNDVNAYTVSNDSYDLKTATVTLTPINEDGYVPDRTGIVMRLDNASGLTDANSGKYVPLFYPSYTRPASSTPVDFPTNNLMYNVEEGIDSDNRNYNEVISKDDVNYTKFILTNKYWTFDKDHTLSTDESATSHTADAAGFYRMHIWKTTGEGDVAAKNTMPAHTAYLLVPSDNLPAAVWTMQEGYAAVRDGRLGVYNITAEGSETAIGGERIVDCELDDGLPWYTISGMKLDAPPTQPGIYIHGGRKVVVVQGH